MPEPGETTGECPYCYGRYAIPGVNDLETVNPVLAREWHTDKNNGLQPSQVMSYTNKKVWWRCEKGHEWAATVADRSSGKGCPFCLGKWTVPGETDLATLMPEIAAEWNYEKTRERHHRCSHGRRDLKFGGNAHEAIHGGQQYFPAPGMDPGARNA